MKQKIVFILVLISLTLAMSETSPLQIVQGIPYEVVHIEQVPTPLTFGENMSVRVQFDGMTNVTYAKLYIYQITEDMLCLCDYRYVIMYEIPTIILAIGSKRYEGNYTVDFLENMQIGYKVQIFYENGSIAMIPKVENFMGITTIEPLNNELMFDAGRVQYNTSVDFNFIYFFGSFLITTALIIKYQKRKLR